MRKIICGLLAAIGIIVAVETANDSENELMCRAIGLSVFAVFSYLGGWWNLARKDTQKAKTDDTSDNSKTTRQ